MQRNVLGVVLLLMWKPLHAAASPNAKPEAGCVFLSLLLVLQEQPMSLAGGCDSPGQSKSVCCVFSFHVSPCFAVFPWPVPVHWARFAELFIPALKVLLLWVHLCDKFLWLQMCLLLEFILPCSADLAFPSPFNWKLHSHCLNLQKQTRSNHPESFCVSCSFCIFCKIMLWMVRWKWKIGDLGENMSYSRKRSISSLCKQENLCIIRHSQIFSLLIFIFPYLPVHLYRLINKQLNIKE